MRPLSKSIQKLLLVGQFKYPVYQEACARALEQLGVEVVRFATEEFFPEGLLGRLQRRFVRGPAIEKLNKALLSEVEKSQIDVVWVYNSPYLFPETLQALKTKAFLAGYTNDNPFGQHCGRVYWKKFRRLIPYYHLWHVYREENLEDFRKAGANRVALLMSYYLPWEVFTEHERPRQEFQYDITFVGHCEKDSRLDYIEAMLQAGLNLRIFGNPRYWKRYSPDRLLQALPEIQELGREEYRNVVRSSKINLCFLSQLNRDNYTRRCFEIPAWGGFLLSERTELLQNLYHETSEADYFSSPEELVQKCAYYLHNESERESVAVKGQSRCLQEGHDVVSRMTQWLKDIEGAMGSVNKDPVQK